MPYCPECGTEVEATDAYCPQCGNSLSGIGDVTDAGEPRRGAEQGAEAAEEPGWGAGGEAAAEAGAGPGSEGASETVEEDEEDDRRIDVPEDPFDLDVFEFSFKYPVARGLREVGIGAIVLFLSFLIVPIFMLVGYSYRVARAAALGHPRPPEWDDWFGLLIDGFRMVIAVAIAGVVGLLGFAVFFLAEIPALAVLWYFAFSFVMTGVIATFYGTGSIKGTYGNLRCLRFMGTTNFWIGYAYQIGISFVLQIGFFVASLLLIITIVGIIPWLLLLPVFLVYSALVQATIWGRIYHDAAESDKVDPRIVSEELPSRW